MAAEVPGVPRVLVLALMTSLFLPAMSGFAQQENVRRTAEAAMTKADREFNQAMADRDLKRFLSFVAPDAAFDPAHISIPRSPQAHKRWTP